MLPAAAYSRLALGGSFADKFQMRGFLFKS
jgi:hypothetical protein